MYLTQIEKCICLKIYSSHIAKWSSIFFFFFLFFFYRLYLGFVRLLYTLNAFDIGSNSEAILKKYISQSLHGLVGRAVSTPLHCFFCLTTTFQFYDYSSRYKIQITFEGEFSPGSRARWEWWCSKFCTCMQSSVLE